MDDNPSTTAGVIGILKSLHKYVPMNKSSLYPLVCHCDGGAFQLSIGAKKAQSALGSKSERLEGLVPTAQEFHKRGILLYTVWKLCIPLQTQDTSNDAVYLYL